MKFKNQTIATNDLFNFSILSEFSSIFLSCRTHFTSCPTRCV